MTQKQAEMIFKSDLLPAIREQEGGAHNESLRASSWRRFTRGLCAEGLVSEVWPQPSWL